MLVGDIGTGKTTIGRALLKRFRNEPDNFLFHLILNPAFESGQVFLAFLLLLFSILFHKGYSSLAYKNAIKNFLFETAVKNNKTIVLKIDEARKRMSVERQGGRIP